jgi:hypothetical protein
MLTTGALVGVASMVLTCQPAEPLNRKRSVEESDRLPQGFAAQNHSGPRAQLGKTFYFGTSKGHVAWLLYIDTGAQSGTLYHPVAMASLCKISRDSAGRLSFESAPIGSTSTIYRFRGQPSEAGIEGIIWEYRGRRIRDSSTLTLRPIRQGSPTQGRPIGVGGLYSAVQYHQATGDLLGRALLLVDDTSGTIVVSIFYEGSPDRPIGATRVESSGDTLRLWTANPISGNELADTVVIGKSGLQFMNGSTMPKKATLAELFSPPPRFKCP